MLSDFLEIPNLRPKADQFLRDTFSHICLGIEPQHDPFAPQTGRFWFILFAIASHVYGWLVLGGILLFLYTVLKPYELQVLGQMLASFSIGGLVTGSLIMMYRIWSAPRIKPISRTRLSITLAVIAVVALIVIQFPIPWYRTSSCLIEPYDVRHVVTKVPGQIEEVFVEPGQYVEKDQLLVQLRDPDWESRLVELKSQIKVQKAEVDLHLALDDQSSRAVAVEMLQGLLRQEAELVEHLSHLKIVAPCSGTVVEPPRQPTTTLEQLEVRLGKWESTPLDPRNRQAFLPERTSILSIAPSNSPEDPERYDAVVYLDQSDRLDVTEEMRIRIKLEHLPHETFTGRVRQIAHAQTEVAPAALSNKQGGAMSTVTDREGQEKLEDAAYQAIIEFQDEPALLRTGLRGQARFVVVERSLGGWLWRWIRRTFDFEL